MRVLSRVHPLHRAERRGERVIFDLLEREGMLPRGGRVLEIGPKHGEDTRMLAGLAPTELVLLDLPEKQAMVRDWLPAIEAQVPTRFIEGNLLYLTPEEVADLGAFDLVWCAGVLYHNVEQIRLLRRLFDLTAPGGMVLVESATTRHPVLRHLNAVEVHWPKTYRNVPTVTHLPSRRAITAWMEMVGFADLQIKPAYGPELRWQRTVIVGKRPEAVNRGYLNYGLYEVGSAT